MEAHLDKHKIVLEINHVSEQTFWGNFSHETFRQYSLNKKFYNVN